MRVRDGLVRAFERRRANARRRVRRANARLDENCRAQEVAAPPRWFYVETYMGYTWCILWCILWFGVKLKRALDGRGARRRRRGDASDV